MQGGCNNICTPVQTTNERHIIEMICKQHRRKAQIRHGLPLRRCKISQQLRDCYMSNNTTLSVNLLRIIVPRQHADDRGWFSEIFHEKRLHDLGITCRFVQDNQAISKRAGTLRGLHFQLPPAAHQAKLVSVLRGRTPMAVRRRRYPSCRTRIGDSRCSGNSSARSNMTAIRRCHWRCRRHPLHPRQLRPRPPRHARRPSMLAPHGSRSFRQPGSAFTPSARRAPSPHAPACLRHT
jgi:hypothetical protein